MSKGSNENSHNPFAKVNLSIDTAPILKEVEAQMVASFKMVATREVRSFFDEQMSWGGGPDKFVRSTGAGLLLIREFLEKKFDDPATLQHMHNYFDNNFERIMEEAMQKAIQHKANAFVFQKTKDKKLPEGSER